LDLNDENSATDLAEQELLIILDDNVER